MSMSMQMGSQLTGRGDAELIATYSGIFAGMGCAFAETLGVAEEALYEAVDEVFIPEDEPLVDMEPCNQEKWPGRYLAFTSDQLEMLRDVVEEMDVVV